MIEIVIEDDIYITKNKNVVDTKIHIEENGRVDIVGNWYKDVTQIFYENITLVSFANRYCEILNKYCSQAL